MNDANQEQFIFYDLAHGDMFRVKKNLEYLESTTDRHLRDVLCRDAIVSYCKPFTSNRGKYQKNKLVVPESFVPKALRSEHKALMNARNELIAHMDISKQSAKLERYDVNGAPHFAYSVKGYELVDFSDLVSHIGELASAVENALLNANTKLKSGF